MSKKTKIIATRSVFFFDNCFLLLLIWQGLEKLFYGKVMSSSFDTFVAVTMLPVLWNMAEYLTLGVNGIRLGPSENYKKNFMYERISCVAKKLIVYVGVWLLGFCIFDQKNNYRNVLLVTCIIGIIFTVCLWITSKYIIAKQDNPNFFQNAIESINLSRVPRPYFNMGVG